MKHTIIKKVGQIGVPVKDLNRALEFYQQKLGLSLLFHTDSMAFFDCDGMRIMLTIPENETFAHASSVIYFQVSDMNATFEELTSKDVHFIGQPHLIAKKENTETWMVFFQDTEGNMHALMSELVVDERTP
ncbi:VOC family protein [Cytobacillus spongiae]|jgi:predicted enzyme related to lactoylglutathione lyase|uniref:VOC family protein n=1 Tax=Cytobacillus spongiae TaxID=2901381 RepID=UPI001F2365C3|nr:VOC family protein [Cytobacillus spongiae]UII55880.1 VOC family protein [Cytobacillus spongiae]